AKLVRQLQQQKVALVVFDLQFIVSDPVNDPALASAMRDAGNVLVTECVQKFRYGAADFFGRDECSDVNKEPAVAQESESTAELAEELVAMRKIPPTMAIRESALDHTPFYLINDAENSTILESWTFFDSLAELPSLPVLTWFYYMQRSGALSDIETTTPLSVWLTEQRRACAEEPHRRLNLDTKFANLICTGNSRYLNYYGPPKTLRMESYADVYEGKVSDLKDKVVFVGRAYRQYSPGKTDFFKTPFSDSHTGKMAGVEIMATQFANLLDNSFIEMPAPALLISALFCFVAVVLLIQFPGWWGILASLAFAFIYAGIALWCFSRINCWLPLSTPLLIQLPLAWLMTLTWSRYDLLRERQRILNFVQRVFPQWLVFLPASPGQWTESNDLSTKSEKDVRGLCLATDIEGYTAIAEHHRPREMWALLNDYYRVLGHPVTSRGGIITDVTGDAMMAVWFDAPAVQRRTVCLAALEIEKAVATFNDSAVFEPLPTRIGLHQGEFALGRLDAGKTSHYRAIGDTVNIASRIQGVNKYLGTKILASKEAVAEINGIALRPVGVFRLVGREEPIELIEITGLQENIATHQAAVYRQFAEGLQLFQHGKWADAARLFKNVLFLDATDGPAQFYLKLALAYSRIPGFAYEGCISLNAK
ncbi:MAG: CHASE2 domain-containing protein, partial [Gammaproteobacteria bacterium]